MTGGPGIKELTFTLVADEPDHLATREEDARLRHISQLVIQTADQVSDLTVADRTVTHTKHFPNFDALSALVNATHDHGKYDISWPRAAATAPLTEGETTS